MVSRKFLVSVCLILLFTTACQQQPIVHDLSERDANEILVLLARNNIPSEKVKEVRNQEIYWQVRVGKGDMVTAQNILVANQLPRVRQGGLEGICKNAGMIVTKETEKCRMLLGFKGEIINSLESIPGVSFADVVLNIPDKEEFPDPNLPQPRPTAAVTVRYLKDANDNQTQLTENKVQEFVANSISGMDPRDVSVIISYVSQSNPRQTLNPEQDNPQEVNGTQPPEDGGEVSALVRVGGIEMSEGSASKFKAVAVLFLLLLLALAGAFIFTLLKMSQMRKQMPVTAEPATAADKKLLST